MTEKNPLKKVHLVADCNTLTHKRLEILMHFLDAMEAFHPRSLNIFYTDITIPKGVAFERGIFKPKYDDPGATSKEIGDRKEKRGKKEEIHVADEVVYLAGMIKRLAHMGYIQYLPPTDLDKSFFRDTVDVLLGIPNVSTPDDLDDGTITALEMAYKRLKGVQNLKQDTKTAKYFPDFGEKSFLDFLRNYSLKPAKDELFIFVSDDAKARESIAEFTLAHPGVQCWCLTVKQLVAMTSNLATLAEKQWDKQSCVKKWDIESVADSIGYTYMGLRGLKIQYPYDMGKAAATEQRAIRQFHNKNERITPTELCSLETALQNEAEMLATGEIVVGHQPNIKAVAIQSNVKGR